ncbi:L-methionine/branched-chain amino acid transporter [Thiofilum flexile]|uniref:L-methionine/branched-chain amino acid transporter n=1 Tax=Thiofilum flexile TaxID=125627 RepID=UPI00036797D7|nr:L-methionine/branched-chain amino acid transporter [Thiofilum flexile]
MARLHQELGIVSGTSLLTTSLLGTGIFVIPALGATVAQQDSLWSWILLILLVIPLGVTFAALGRRYPHAGGVSHYISRSFGAQWEMLTALLFLTVIPVGLPAALMIAVGFIQSVWAVPAWELLLIQILTLLAMLGLGLAGAKTSGQVQFIIALLIIAMVVALWSGAQISRADITPPAMTVDALPEITRAMGVMFWCFVGLEAFAHLGEEFRRPERDLPIAILLGILIAGLVYWACAVVVIKLGAYGTQEANTQAVPHMLALLFGAEARWVAAIVGFLACFASMNIYVQGFARLIWSLADEGKLPPYFAHTNARKIPTHALYATVATCMTFATLFWWWQSDLDALIRYANGNFVLLYLLCMLAGVKLLSGWARGVAVLSTLLCAFMFVFLGAEGYYALAVVGLFVGYLFIQKWRAVALKSS